MLIQLIVLQVIVFSGVIFFMKKILSSDTQAAVGRLDEVYQDLLQKQKDLTKKIEEAEKEYQQKKEEGEAIAEKLKNDAADEMREKKDEILKQAKAQADEIVGRAKASADEMRSVIEREEKAKALDNASHLLKEAFQDKTCEDLHKVVFEDFLQKGKDFDLSKVGDHINILSVRTAYPLTEEVKNKINAFVAAKLDRTLKIEEIPDKDLLAGVVLQFGTLILDGSLVSTVREAAEVEKTRLETES